jgi:hypothetical protein
MFKTLAFCGMLLLVRSCQHAPTTNAETTIFETLQVDQTAIAGLRTPIKDGYPKYVPEFNEAADAYAIALIRYRFYHEDPATDHGEMAQQLDLVDKDVIALQKVIHRDLPVGPDTRTQVAISVEKKQAKAMLPSRLSNVLAALQSGAQLAEVVPVASPYAALASVLISIAQNAASNLQTTTGPNPSELTTVPRIETR